MLSSPASDLDQELDQESDLPPAQLELEVEEEEEEWDETPSSVEEVPPLPQVKSWADEPSSLDPQPAKEPLEEQEPVEEPLEQQVAILTKKLAEAEDAAVKAAFKARERISRAESEAQESKRSLSLGRRHCVTKIQELITVDEPQTWSKNTEHLIALLATTVKLSEFTMSPEGKVTVKEGCHPFADLLRDTQAVSDKHKVKASARAQEVINGVLVRVKKRFLDQASNKSRSASRSREPDSEEELPSSKVPKASPLSPPHLGEGSEGWPALPTPGAKVGLQEPTQALGGKTATSPRRESPGTSSPRKALQPTKIQVTSPQQSPKGATSPQKDSMVPEGPVSQPQLISSQVPSKTDGLSSGLKNPLVLAKGSKERPQEVGHLGVSNKGTKEALKPQGSHLKAPQSRPQGSTSKGDSKVTLKARQ